MFGVNLWLLTAMFSWQLTFRQLSTVGDPPDLFPRLLGPAYARVGLSVGRLRPEGVYIGPWVRVHVAWEMEVHWASVPLDFPLFQRPTPLRWRALAWEDSTGSVRLRSELDRLELRIRLPQASFTLGRQPVSMGRSHLLGVMDVLAPFPPFALDADVKPGVDVLRGRWIVTDNLESTVLVHDRHNMVFQTTGYGTPGTLDLLLGRLRDRSWAAVVWEGTWRETAGWMEGTLLDGYGQVAVGLEHHLPRTRLALEGILQHPDPQTRPATVQAWLREGLRRLACHRCLMTFAERKWHPLVRSGLGALISADDGSVAGMVQVFLDLSDTQDMVLWYFEGFPSRVQDPGTVGGTGRWFGLYTRWFW